MCHADTCCNTKYDGAGVFVSGAFVAAITADLNGIGVTAGLAVDFDTLLQLGLYVHMRSTINPGDPSADPTTGHIDQPPNFLGRSDVLSDH